MSAASNYTENNVMAALFDGVAMPIPTHTYIALHTSDSSETGGGEVTTGTWPSYIRKCAEVTGDMGTGWTATANGERKNAKTISFVVYDGVPDLTLTHWSVWDAAVGGNMLAASSLTAARTLEQSDVLEFSIGALTVRQS